MYYTCDDIGTEHRDKLWKLDELKIKIPTFKVTCFVIAEDTNGWFGKWFKERSGWIEVAVHGYSHKGMPECERNDKKERILNAFEILQPYLPEIYGFRAPGFQMTASTYPIIKELGFWYIAHQTRIQPLKEIGKFRQYPLINTHIYENLKHEAKENFKFISEGFGYR